MQVLWHLQLRHRSTGHGSRYSGNNRCGVLALAAGLYSSISFLIMRPPSALPFTSLRLMPFSFAILRAKGDALIRLSSSVEPVVSDTSAATAGSSFGNAFSSFGSCRGGRFHRYHSSNGVISVPALPTIAIMPFTLAASPSLGPIYNNVPAS